MTFQAWKIRFLNSMTFQDVWEPSCRRGSSETRTTEAAKILDLFTDPIFNLLNLVIELEDVFGLLETFSTLTWRLQQLVPLHYQTVNALLYLWRRLVMFLQQHLPSLQNNKIKLQIRSDSNYTSARLSGIHQIWWYNGRDQTCGGGITVCEILEHASTNILSLLNTLLTRGWALPPLDHLTPIWPLTFWPNINWWTRTHDGQSMWQVRWL